MKNDAAGVTANAILAIDAAWTANEPSGVALVAESSGSWNCVALGPSYESFLGQAQNIDVNWHQQRFEGCVPEPSSLLSVAHSLLGQRHVTLVTVDMPVALEPITARREADDCISRTFGSRNCGAHSPGITRPGKIGKILSDGFQAEGFPVATSQTMVGTPSQLLEVYPHPALLTLLPAEDRVKYKVGKSRNFWPGNSVEIRISKLLEIYDSILLRLRQEIDGIMLTLPAPSKTTHLSELKRYEDTIDALICAWVGIRYFANDAKAYGDHIAAIWVP